MQFSLYTTAFNIIRGEFKIESAIKNYLSIADEVVIATIKPKLMVDNIFETQIFKDIEDKYKNVKVIYTDVDPYNDPLWDGKIKNEALQNCSHEYCIQCDLDERIGGTKDFWKTVASSLDEKYRAIMLPVLNIHTDIDHYRDIGYKWYLHKKTGTKRGPIKQAFRGDGTVDTSKSDGTELLDGNDELVNFLTLDLLNSMEALEYMKNGGPSVYHFGYANLARRAKLNKDFWKKSWSSLNGIEATDVHTDVESLIKFNLPKHGLKLPEY